MKQTFARHCPECKQYGEAESSLDSLLFCPHCRFAWGKVKNVDDVFDYCPMCDCRQFYLSKDFNQFLGCGIMALGIVLVPWSYGISLPVFALVDWFLHRRVPTIINCYRCGCEFRGFVPEQKRFKPFLHHIGLKYDKYR